MNLQWDIDRERLPVDTYGYRLKHPVTLEEQKAEMERIARLTGKRPTYYSCGICGAYHWADYHGDCRNDLYRIADPDELHGPDGWDEVLMDGDEETCPACGGDGVGRFGPGACSFCDGSGTVPADEVERIRDTILDLKGTPLV